MTASSKTSEDTLTTASSGGREARRGTLPGLFNPRGFASRLEASPLFAIGPSEPGPALRRGALVAVPIAVALTVELGFDAPTEGAIATGALICGFAGMDAEARPRAAWQAATTVPIGLAAALGVLSSQWAPAAVVAMALLGALAGYCFAYSLRLAICGLSVVLALLISQGLFLPAGDAPKVLMWGMAGGATQVLWSLLVWLVADRGAAQPDSGWDRRRLAATFRSNLTLESHAARHALRFGLSLGAGVAAYRLLGMRDHGFWVPLTILFVMRPEREETYRRLILRAVGTLLGLAVATAVAEAFGGSELVDGVVLTLAAALSFGLLTVQYALFTAAITTYVVLLSDTLGENALRADGQRGLGTALGIAVAFLAFVLWPNRDEGGPAPDAAEPVPPGAAPR